MGDEPAVEVVETAPPRAGEVRVRVVASGICGSDLHVLDGRSGAMTLPVVMGHEGAGVVEAVGPGATIPIDGRALFTERRLLGCLGGSNVPARDIPPVSSSCTARVGSTSTCWSPPGRPLDEVAAALDETRRGEVARSVVVLGA